MKPAPGVWGIDLGQCALKAMRLQLTDGQMQATAFDYIEYPKILSQPDADPDQLVREALVTFLSRNSVRGDTVAIAVPGQAGLVRFVKLPPVEEKKIAEIVKFEAKQQIPFPLEEVVWDFQKLGSGEVIDGLALETEIGLFAMKRDAVAKYLQHFKEVNVDVHCIQMAPLSLCNYIAYDLLGKDSVAGAAPAGEEKKGCVVGLDVGTDSSNMVVTDGGRIIWQRPIPLGGNHFTRALTKELKLTFVKAEHLKRNAAKSGAAELKKMLGTLKPVLTDFVGEVQRSLNFFTNTHRDATIDYMVGLGNAFRLPGMSRFLADKLQLEVRKVDKMARLTGDEVIGAPIFAENLPTFGVCYGLALQGMARAKLLTNLLPPEIRLERLIRAKKPWAVAAAALLLLGLGGAALGNYLNQRPYSTPEVQTAIKTANDTAGNVKSMESRFQTTKTGAIAEEEAVKAIVAGQFERENWLRLMQFVSGCIPQPDGSNLTPVAKRKYFDQRRDPRYQSGKEAFKAYVERKSEGLAGPMDDKGAVAADTLPPGVDDLIQFHVEAVEARFCDDLSVFWTAAKKDKEAGDVRPTEHFTKKPEGKGWVVEMSGYTWHRDKERFVRETLLETIARKGIVPVAAPQDGKPQDGKPATPMPPAAPGDKPAEAGAADFAATKKPVINRIGHVILYKYWAQKADGPGGFSIIDSSYADTLLNGGTATAGGKPGVPGMPGSPGSPGMPGMPGGSPTSMTSGGPSAGGAEASGASAGPAAFRAAWKPLSPRGAATGTATGMGAGALGGYPGMPMNPSQPRTKTPAAGTAKHERTEFVIFFIWQEPTPSDSLRGPEGQGVIPGASSGKAGGPGMPGMPGMPGGMPTTPPR